MPITVNKSDIVAAKDQYADFLAGRSGGFVAGLFELILHADNENRRKLALAFPAQVYVYIQAVESNRIDFVMEEDAPVPGDPDWPVPDQQQCFRCDCVWDYSEEIKECPKCGTEATRIIY